MAELRELSRSASYRRRSGAFVVPSAKLITDALSAGLKLRSVFASLDLDSARSSADLAGHRELRKDGVPPGLGVEPAQAWRVPVSRLAAAVDMPSPPDLVAVFDLPDPDRWVARPGRPALLLPEVGDSGNVGAAVRSAAAAGFGRVEIGPGSADPFGPRAIRAAAGATFFLPVATDRDPVRTLERYRSEGYRRIGLSVRGGRSLFEADLVAESVLVVGHETRGLSPAVELDLDELVSIPMPGRVESLNLAAAVAVVCFEMVRRQAKRCGDARAAIGS